MQLNQIIRRPLITEKIYDQIEKDNKIVFEVGKMANKFMIKAAVEELYKVKVRKGNTLITPLGVKHAICALEPEYSASDLATELNLFG
ncbi:MAG: 50S ribosomal protein L23 [Candidatus Heimdallarchaeota archaeon]|nr:50S ribosomal protein L23 [Candidatus Heimdallarchaeota archaeon]